MKARKGRGSIFKRGPDHWQIRIELPSNTKKRAARYATVRGSRADAERALTEMLAKHDTGTLPEPTKATVAEYLTHWLDTAHSRSAKTLERYGELYRYQIAPYLGPLKLVSLRAEHIRQWHRDLLDAGKHPNTVRHAHRLAVTALKDTAAHERIKAVMPPRAPHTEPEILSPDDVRRVFEALDGHEMLPLVRMALATGMRRGELLGLQWGDVDLDAGTVRVARAVEETSQHGQRLKEPKTKAGRRIVKLDGETVALLRELRLAHMQRRIALGAGKIEPATLVFGTVNETLRSPRAVSRAWRRLLDAKGLPSVSFHSLRHTHASLLIAEGVNVLVISKRLGHANPSVTLNVYGHLMPGDDEKAAAAIEGALK